MAYQRLNYEDRILISIRLREGFDYQTIADELRRSKSTISREVRRGCITDSGESVYSAAATQQRASERRK